MIAIALIALFLMMIPIWILDIELGFFGALLCIPVWIALFFGLAYLIEKVIDGTKKIFGKKKSVFSNLERKSTELKKAETTETQNLNSERYLEEKVVFNKSVEEISMHKVDEKMVSNETKKACKKVDDAVEKLIATASNELSQASSRLLAAERMMASASNVPFAARSAYSTLRELPGQLNEMAMAQLISLIKPSGNRLNKMLKQEEMDVDEAWYIVEHLEALVKKAKVLEYTKAKSGFDAKCYEPMEKVVVKFREAVLNHRSVQRGLKQEQLEKNQKELVRVKNEFEENKKAVTKHREELSEMFERYNYYVSLALAEAKSEYQYILKCIEAKQQELVRKSKVRVETFDLLARASIFNKKARELEYRNAEDDYQRTYNQLNQLRESLRSFAKVTFATKYDTIDKRIDDLLSKIKKLNDDISANETAIESYKNAIEGLKGELNG